MLRWVRKPTLQNIKGVSGPPREHIFIIILGSHLGKCNKIGWDNFSHLSIGLNSLPRSCGLQQRRCKKHRSRFIRMNNNYCARGRHLFNHFCQKLLKNKRLSHSIESLSFYLNRYSLLCCIRVFIILRFHEISWKLMNVTFSYKWLFLLSNINQISI